MWHKMTNNGSFYIFLRKALFEFPIFCTKPIVENSDGFDFFSKLPIMAIFDPNLFYGHIMPETLVFKKILSSKNVYYFSKSKTSEKNTNFAIMTALSPHSENF